MDPTTTPQQTIAWCEAQVNSVKDDDLEPTYSHWLAPFFDGCHAFSHSIRKGLTGSENDQNQGPVPQVNVAPVYLADERFPTIFFDLSTPFGALRSSVSRIDHNFGHGSGYSMRDASVDKQINSWDANISNLSLCSTTPPRRPLSSIRRETSTGSYNPSSSCAETISPPDLPAQPYTARFATRIPTRLTVPPRDLLTRLTFWTRTRRHSPHERITNEPCPNGTIGATRNHEPSALYILNIFSDILQCIPERRNFRLLPNG